MKLLKIQVILLQISTALFTSERLRLMNGSKSNQGRVEIYHSGQWGTICDNIFYADEARAVCNALGYRDGIPLRRAHFGRGTGRIWVDYLHCSLLDSGQYSLQLGKTLCYFKGWGVSNCDHGDDAGVECKACDEGQFGYSCRSTCHCKIPGCDSTTGLCDSGGCLPGWRGISCSLACSSGTFGQTCSSRCHCRYSGGCDPVTGVCKYQSSGCSAGWTGIRCDQECDEEKFGLSCSSKCHCKDPGCNSANGVCKSKGCLPGWRGASCSQVCSNGTFGQSCTSKCHCRSSGCDHVTGVCRNQSKGCLDGWIGTRCDQECIFCSSSECDQVTGVCTNLTKCCLYGPVETNNGQEKQDINNVGYKVGVSFLTILLVISIVLSIGLYVTLKRIKRKNSNSTTENYTSETNYNRRLRETASSVHRDLQDIASIAHGNVAFQRAQVAKDPAGIYSP